MNTKKEFVFQGYDGLIHGEFQFQVPFVIGRINSQNRKDGVPGRWMEKADLTERELSRTAHEKAEDRVVSLLRNVIAALENLGEYAYALDTEEHVRIYREFLVERNNQNHG